MPCYLKYETPNTACIIVRCPRKIGNCAGKLLISAGRKHVTGRKRNPGDICRWNVSVAAGGPCGARPRTRAIGSMERREHLSQVSRRASKTSPLQRRVVVLHEVGLLLGPSTGPLLFIFNISLNTCALRSFFCLDYSADRNCRA